MQQDARASRSRTAGRSRRSGSVGVGSISPVEPFVSECRLNASCWTTKSSVSVTIANVMCTRAQRDPRDRQRGERDAGADERQRVERVVARADAEVLERDPERVRAEPEERGLPERDVARVAGEEVPRRRERRVHQRQHADVDDPRRRGRRTGRRCRRRERAAAASPQRSTRLTVSRSRTPKIPCGRTSRNAIRTTKNENDAQIGEISTATIASITPMTSAATTAPPRLPRPPSTTIESSREIRS